MFWIKIKFCIIFTKKGSIKGLDYICINSHSKTWWTQGFEVPTSRVGFVGFIARIGASSGKLASSGSILDTGGINAFLGAHFLEKGHFDWVFQIALRGTENPVCAGCDFFIGWWKSEEEWFLLFEPFFKLKSLHDLCAQREYEVHNEISTGTMTTAKNEGFIGLTWKLSFSGGNEPVVGGRVYWGGIFPVVGNEQIFG